MQERATSPDEDESRLLTEIGALVDVVRDLRRDAVTNSDQIKALTVELRGKWDELRATRGTRTRNDFAVQQAVTDLEDHAGKHG